MADYTLVSPDGNEYQTSSPTYANRLRAQGYSDKQAPPAAATPTRQTDVATTPAKPAERSGDKPAARPAGDTSK